MHRYWDDVFPEDFPERMHAAADSHEPLMRFALRVLDDMLAEALAWALDNPELVVILASSMGQDAVHRRNHEGVELVVEDLALLMSHTGISREDYSPLLAMVPQIAVEIRDGDKRARARRVLEGAFCSDAKRFIGVQEIGSSLSITVHTPTLGQMSGDTFFINGAAVAWRDAGIRKQDIEPGTGYHSGGLARRLLRADARRALEPVEIEGQCRSHQGLDAWCQPGRLPGDSVSCLCLLVTLQPGCGVRKARESGSN